MASGHEVRLRGLDHPQILLSPVPPLCLCASYSGPILYAVAGLVVRSPWPRRRKARAIRVMPKISA